MSEKKEVTSVQSVDVDLSDLLGTGSDAVMVPGEPKAPKEKNIFAPMSPDTKFLDKPENLENPKDPENPDPVDPDPADPADPDPVDPIDPVDPFEIPADPEAPSKAGRPKVIVGATKKLIEKGILTPFDDDKDLKDYTEEDFEELITANFERQSQKMSSELSNEFMESLPPEMRQAYHYISNGGTDMKGMFQALASTQEIHDLDITQESGQKSAVRNYLEATQWGTADEIEEEINSLEDNGNLEKKAKQFKPKLDNMHQQVVDQKLITQQTAAKQRADASQNYIESVYSTLEKGELGGMKLDNKMQNMLYSGLVQSNYPSISGKQTNMLGHLLEKHQWVEPRHDLIAEALWLLADPDSYHKSIASKTELQVNEKTLRTLKTEQSNKGGDTAIPKGGGNRVDRKPKGLPRQTKNFFGR